CMLNSVVFHFETKLLVFINFRKHCKSISLNSLEIWVIKHIGSYKNFHFFRGDYLKQPYSIGFTNCCMFVTKESYFLKSFSIHFNKNINPLVIWYSKQHYLYIAPIESA
ncbi:hypothetical protein PFISCL1PPCAC_529, partial [Pristionchus fissidentatus]